MYSSARLEEVACLSHPHLGMAYVLSHIMRPVHMNSSRVFIHFLLLWLLDYNTPGVSPCDDKLLMGMAKYKNWKSQVFIFEIFLYGMDSWYGLLIGITIQTIRLLSRAFEIKKMFCFSSKTQFIQISWGITERVWWKDWERICLMRQTERGWGEREGDQAYIKGAIERN